jgi:DNA-binding PadR family transcriptional regulator
LKGDNLGEFEELVLLAVRARGEEATGATIQEELERRAGRVVTLGAIYAALDRGERKKLVTSWLGEPVRAPGGRRRRHYAVTPAGERSLSDSRRVRESFWRAGEATT